MTNRNSALWIYLEESGILEHGSPEQINAIKREYRRKYLKNYKSTRRKQGLEVVVTLSEKERERLHKQARRHQLSLPRFLRQSSIAFLNQTYLVPNAAQVARMEQALAECIREIQAIGKSRERRWLSQEWKIEALVAQVEKLSTQLTSALRYPPLQHDSQNQITKDDSRL